MKFVDSPNWKRSILFQFHLKSGWKWMEPSKSCDYESAEIKLYANDCSVTRARSRLSTNNSGNTIKSFFFFASFAFWLVEFLFWNISIENNKLVLVSFFDAVHRLNFLCMKRKRSKSIVRIGLTTSPSSECIRSRRDVSVKWLTFFRKWKKKHTLGKEQHD